MLPLIIGDDNNDEEEENRLSDGEPGPAEEGDVFAMSFDIAGAITEPFASQLLPGVDLNDTPMGSLRFGGSDIAGPSACQVNP